jgi:hypothetical protein
VTTLISFSIFTFPLDRRGENEIRNLILTEELAFYHTKYLRVLLAINWLAATHTEYGGMEVAIGTHIAAQLYDFIQELNVTMSKLLS